MKAEQIDTEATLALFRVRSKVKNDSLATVIVMENAARVIDELDKGEHGANAVKALLDLWRELKLTEITSENLSTLRAVVDRIHAKAVAESRGQQR